MALTTPKDWRHLCPIGATITLLVGPMDQSLAFIGLGRHLADLQYSALSPRPDKGEIYSSSTLGQLLSNSRGVKREAKVQATLGQLLSNSRGVKREPKSTATSCRPEQI